MTTLSESIADAEAKIGAGDARGAFDALRGQPGFPAPELTDAGDFGRAFSTFASVAEAIAGPELGTCMRKLADAPDDPQALYDGGYALYEQRLFEIGATAAAPSPAPRR